MQLFDVPCVKPRSQGAQANSNGKNAEATIYCILKERGYDVRQQQTIGIGLYNTPIRVDVMVMPCSRFPAGLIIESKWQETAGSADEKFPYLVINIKRFYPMPCIVVLDGDGYRDGAANYLRSEVDGKSLQHVFSFAEFLTWCNRNL